MKNMIYTIIFLISSTTLTAYSSDVVYPNTHFYGNFTSEEKQEIISVISDYPPRYFQNVKKVEIYSYDLLKKGAYICGKKIDEEFGGFYCKNGKIIIDKKGIDSDMNYVLNHELIHSKCYSKKYKWDMSHKSRCFNEGLA